MSTENAGRERDSEWFCVVQLAVIQQKVKSVHFDGKYWTLWVNITMEQKIQTLKGKLLCILEK